MMVRFKHFLVVALTAAACFTPAFAGMTAHAGPSYGIRVALMESEAPVKGAQFSCAKAADNVGGTLEWTDAVKAIPYFAYTVDDVYSQTETVANVLAEHTDIFGSPAQGMTDDSGSFTFSGLGSGIYFLWESNRTDASTRYTVAHPMLVALPAEEGGDVQEVYPKVEKMSYSHSSSHSSSRDHDPSSTTTEPPSPEPSSTEEPSSSVEPASTPPTQPDDATPSVRRRTFPTYDTADMPVIPMLVSAAVAFALGVLVMKKKGSGRDDGPDSRGHEE